MCDWASHQHSTGGEPSQHPLRPQYRLAHIRGEAHDGEHYVRLLSHLVKALSHLGFQSDTGERCCWANGRTH